MRERGSERERERWREREREREREGEKGVLVQKCLLLPLVGITVTL